MSDVSNRDDIINVSDIDKRIAELESERGALVEAANEAQTTYREEATPDTADELGVAFDEAHKAVEEWNDSGEGKELKTLTDLRSECGEDETLIHEAYFETYAQELAESCCDMNQAHSWPFSCIDWERAARELQHDYSCVEFDGVTYYTRG